MQFMQLVRFWYRNQYVSPPAIGSCATRRLHMTYRYYQEHCDEMDGLVTTYFCLYEESAHRLTPYICAGDISQAHERGGQ